MSVVAIRNGIIAADTFGQYGDVEIKSNKLMRRVLPEGDTVIGHAGNTADGQSFTDWFFAGHDLENIPKLHNRDGKDVSFSAIVLNVDGWYYWDDWFVEDKDLGIQNEYFAIGMGQEAAMGAFHMGATAIEAVEAACATIKGCALPIEWEAIEQYKPTTLSKVDTTTLAYMKAMGLVDPKSNGKPRGME